MPIEPFQRLLDDVRRTLDETGWIEPGDHVLVGLSGGPDSVALLHLLRELRDELGFTLGACHLDHGLRGDASRADEAFCRAMCAEMSIPLALDEARAHRVSPEPGAALAETRARTLRYAFFREAAARTKATHLALAHHRDDQVETILHRMLRGTGLAGLRGIPASRPLASDAGDAGNASNAGDSQVRIIRPLLGVTKAEIVESLDRRGIPYCIDATNERLDTPRNRIRAEVLPWLAERFDGDPAAALERLAVHADEADAYLEAAARKAERACRLASNDPNAGRFDSTSDRSSPIYDRGRLAALERPILRRVIASAFESVADRGIELAESDRVLHGLTSFESRELSLRGGIRVSAHGNAWRVHTGTRRSHPESSAAPADLAQLPRRGPVDVAPLATRFEVTPLAETEPDATNDPSLAYFETNTLRWPLRIRTRRDGDRIRLERGGHKKLQDLFVDRKIPRWKRDRIPLVVDADDRVLWVVGIRRSADTIAPPDATDARGRGKVTAIRATELPGDSGARDSRTGSSGAASERSLDFPSAGSSVQ